MGLFERFWRRKSTTVTGGIFQTGSNSSMAPSSFSSAGALLQAYNQSPWLRAVVSRIADTAASSAITIHRADRTLAKSMRKMRPHRRAKLMQRHKDAIEEIESHPVLDLLQRGNPVLDGFESRALTFTYQDLIGNALWLLERNGDGIPVEFWPFPTTWVRGLPSKKNNDNWIINWLGQSRNEKSVPKEDIIWFKTPDPTRPYGFGTGLAQVLGDELDVDEYASKLLKAGFYNRGHLDLVVSIEGAGDDELARIQENFEARHRGWSKAFSPLFHSGTTKIDRISQTFEDLEILDLRRFERDFVVQVFGVPPEVLGITENANRATITQALFIMARMVLTPRLSHQAGVVERTLLADDPTLFASYEDPAPDDADLELEYMKAQPHAATQNEWRARQGLPNIGAQGDIFVRPLGVTVTPKAQVRSTPAPPPPLYLSLPIKPKATLTQAQLELVIDSIRPELMSESLGPLWSRKFLEIASSTLEGLEFAGSFDLLNPLVEQHVAEFSSTQIKYVTETTQAAVREALANGVAARETISELGNRVREAMGGEAWKNRRLTIARTETLRSSNAATFAAYRVAGVERKEYIATPDSNVRPEHLQADGQTRAVGEPFELGDGTLTMFPGNSGIAKHDINCRCTIGALTADEDEETAEAALARRKAAWKVFDETVSLWESEALPFVDEGMQKQLTEALKVLEDLA